MSTQTFDAARILDLYRSIWVDGKLELVPTLFAPDVVRHQPVSVRPPKVTGRETYEAYIAEFRNLHPDLSVELEDVIVGGDRIAYRYTASAFIDDTKAKRFTYSGVTVVRIDEEGRIAEEWLTWDTFDLLVQVGAVAPREP